MRDCSDEKLLQKHWKYFVWEWNLNINKIFYHKYIIARVFSGTLSYNILYINKLAHLILYNIDFGR